METIVPSKINEVWMHVDADDSVKEELSDYFCFDVPGARHTPQFKKGGWDGKIRLFNKKKSRIYLGLLNRLKEFAQEKEYEIVPGEGINEEDAHIDWDVVKKVYDSVWDESLNKEQLEIQVKTWFYCLRKERATVVSPTASGKSLIIFFLCRYYLEYLNDPKVLIIVPTTNLVNQMSTDFQDYGIESDLIHEITGGVDKNTDKSVVVSTWQSIYKEDEDYLNQYDVVVGDECHLYEAKSVSGLLEKMTEVRYRFGFTGTLKESKTNEMSLNGLFGPIKQFVKTKELMDMDVLSNIDINAVVLDYSDKEKTEVANQHRKYQKEIDYIVTHKKRLHYVARLADALSKERGNTLVLYNLVEKHGIPLYNILIETSDANVHLVHGGVDKEYRNEIRRVCEESNDNIVVASYGTYSTGINIRNLHCIVFASPYKSKIKVIQSIGRGLRKHDSKEKLYLVDLVDNFKRGQRANHTLKHFMERMRMYNEEKLNYQIHKVDI